MYVDHFTLNLQVQKYLHQKQQGNLVYFPDFPPSTLGNDFQLFLGSTLFSDVELQVSEESGKLVNLKSHKLFLCRWKYHKVLFYFDHIRYFRALYCSGFRETSSTCT